MGDYIELRIPNGNLRVLLRAIRAEVRRLEIEIATTMERIRKLEEKYGMKSGEFLSHYLRGELGDSEDYME